MRSSSRMDILECLAVHGIQSTIIICLYNWYNCLPGCDGHGSTTPLGEARVGRPERLMHVHAGVDDGLAVAGPRANFVADQREVIRSYVIGRLQVHARCKLLANLVKQKETLTFTFINKKMSKISFASNRVDVVYSKWRITKSSYVSSIDLVWRKLSTGKVARERHQ